MKLARSLFALVITTVLAAAWSLQTSSTIGSPAVAATVAAAAAAAASTASSPAASSSSGSASAAGLPGPTNAAAFLRMDRRSLFVLVYASDPLTASYLSYEVATNLSHATAQVSADDKRTLWLLPEPAWSLSDYATQCQNDPERTAGALVVFDVENDSGNFNFFLVNTYTQLYAKALFVNCEAFKPPFGSKYPGITTYSQQATYNETPARPDPSTCSLQSVPGDKKDTACLNTPTPLSQAPPPSRTVAVADNIVPPSPTPAPPAAFPSSRLTTDTFPTPAQVTETETTNVIPSMKVTWLSDEIRSRHDAGHELSLPFLSIAALGTYLASRTYSQMTSVQQVSPTIPGQPTTTVTTSKTGNNSVLPYGLGFVGGSLSQLSSLSLGGTNQTRILKSAASSFASELRGQIQAECVTYSDVGTHKAVGPKNASEDLCRVFDWQRISGKP